MHNLSSIYNDLNKFGFSDDSCGTVAYIKNRLEKNGLLDSKAVNRQETFVVYGLLQHYNPQQFWWKAAF